MPSIIVVKATFDDEAQVWFTESADLPGLRIEGDTLEEVQAKLPGAIQDLVEAGDGGGGDEPYDVPVELIAHASSRVRLRADA